MKPLVSILIPAYNAEAWISDTLRSAIAQTWERKEIIVVDDGSKDQTLAVARQFESEQLKVVTQKNQGASATRNNAFAMSKGDYVQWLDADDLMAPEKTASQMEAAERSGSKRTLISGAWARFMHRPYRAEFRPSPLWEDLLPAEWLMRKMEHDTYMQTATWLVSRELAEAAGKWDTRLLGDDDGEFFCRVLLASEGTRFVKESKVYYRASRREQPQLHRKFQSKTRGTVDFDETAHRLPPVAGGRRTRARCLRDISPKLDGVFLSGETRSL